MKLKSMGSGFSESITPFSAICINYVHLIKWKYVSWRIQNAINYTGFI